MPFVISMSLNSNVLLLVAVVVFFNMWGLVSFKEGRRYLSLWLTPLCYNQCNTQSREFRVWKANALVLWWQKMKTHSRKLGTWRRGSQDPKLESVRNANSVFGSTGWVRNDRRVLNCTIAHVIPCCLCNSQCSHRWRINRVNDRWWSFRLQNIQTVVS